MNAAKEANEHGAFVDSKTPDKLAGAKVAITSDGMAGVAVKADGDIVAVFKHPSKKAPRAIRSIMTLARAKGGTKGDCFGKGLVKMYEEVGLVPVAKIPFYDGDIAKDENGRAIDPKDQILLDQRPDVFVLMTNGDDFATATKKIANNEYPISTQEELDALPVFANDTGYTDALEYRDALLAGDTKKAEKIRSEKAEKTAKEEAKPPQDKSQEKPQKTKAQQKADAEKDAKAKRLLTKDAYDKVYTPLVNVLEQAQPEVAKAARDTALLMAKTADILHKRFNMKWENAPRVLLGGAIFNENNEYYSPAYDVSRKIKTLSAFRAKYIEREKQGESINKIRVKINGVNFTEERIRHIDKKHHFTDKQLDDLAEHIDTIYDACKSGWQGGNYTGQYDGIHVISRVEGALGSYYVAITVRNDGNIFFDTAVFHKDAKGVKKEIEQRFSAEVLSPIGAASNGPGPSISLKSLPEMLGIVKKPTEFNQTAWHGSPYTFDAFDISKIGIGEGHQAHRLARSFPLVETQQSEAL